LRRRLSQADGLVKATDASLRDIRTSHGIGVRLRWELLEPKDGPIGRIRDLVTESAAVRPAEHADELIRLLKERVDERFKDDEAAGYSEHLRAALDYRQWHRVEVPIVGPAPGQVRKISRRAKLSQGETRFVSYLALFAAADACLSGLPSTGLALRLILLDDAFAKVDDRTIGELMGLLVRMDVGFCMTGHALWGAYPQVPSLDIYEIRRAEGTAAAANHVHWDGHNGTTSGRQAARDEEHPDVRPGLPRPAEPRGPVAVAAEALGKQRAGCAWLSDPRAGLSGR
jgi:Putative exonuclease SbcCD, C subunit